ncbi:pseudouridine synthase [Pelosinus sp. IPA-1]|uniref:pseudouridine synthase n=1 Tax=Pelosinus sp. IPA-1 TaxID=3029569 RepID=UPI002553244A|nr:pseudouridine synthase [Pelosinus sp. IPA-1]
MLERLQKVISQAGVASRRESEKIIQQGRVTVNGKVVTEMGTKVIPGKDRIMVDGKPIAGEKLVYILLYKPKGILTTLKDPQDRKTVASLVSDITQRIYPVGRLDYNTEGLLLLTNDGALTHALIHPSKKIDKTYIAKVAGRPSQEKLDLLRVGIQLEDGMTAPAVINMIDFDRERNMTSLQITIHEGKNRQIRRMFEAIGSDVKQLKRVQFAFLTLEGLRRGSYRHLLPQEVEALQNLNK